MSTAPRTTARRYTLRPQTPAATKPPVYALSFELPEPRQGMIRAFLVDVAMNVAAVTVGIALMIDN
jgi:hypothetical protein